MSKSEPKTYIITAGGTREYIDNVRFIANHATGALPAAMANALCKDNHVVFIHAPMEDKYLRQIPRSTCAQEWISGSVTMIPVVSANEMAKALERECRNRHPDVVICAAAVADFAPVKVDGKIHSTYEFCPGLPDMPDDPNYVGPDIDNSLTIKLFPTPKVIDVVKKVCPTASLLGFKFLSNATEEQLVAAAEHLMDRSGADAVFCNTLENYPLRCGTLIRKGYADIDLDGEGDYFKLAHLILQWMHM